MAVPPEFLQTIEQTAFSTWIRESLDIYAYWLILTFHAIGLALVVGSSTVIDLRILGVARDLPLAPLKRLYPFIVVGFCIQVVSGVLLLMAYPTKSLTNWDFYLKLVLIAAAMMVMLRLRRNVLDDASLSEAAMMVKGRTLATWSLVLWLGVVTTGRFLAYTSTYLTYPVGRSAVNDAGTFLRSLLPL